jgi:hypothetical protein
VIAGVDVANSGVAICIEEVSNTTADYHRYDLQGE